MEAVPTSPIRVTMVSPAGIEKPDGGITQLLSYFLRHVSLERSAFEFDIFETRTRTGAVSKHLSSIRRLGEFRKHIARHGTTIVHIHVAPRGSTYRKMLFARVAKRAGCKIVLHLHGSGYDEFFSAQLPMFAARIRSFFQSADAVIALGDRWRSFVCDELGVDKTKVHSINNGVPIPAQPSRADNPSPVRILFAGAVGQRKGVDVLVQSLARLKELDWVCVICGDGELDRYREMARLAEIPSERIHFAGWQTEPDVREWMRKSDIFVLPSRAENQPVAILEAMAHGLPVVSTSVGDIPNQVTHGSTGFVVQPGDVVSLANRISELTESLSLRRKMGQAGREKFVSEYSIEQNICATISVYEGILGRASTDDSRATTSAI